MYYNWRATCNKLEGRAVSIMINFTLNYLEYLFLVLLVEILNINKFNLY